MLALALGCGGEGGVPDSGAGLDAGQADAAVTACERDRDCADALFCNGEERCMPGAEGADARGCVAGAPACAVDCDEERDLCSGCDTDADGDGEIARSCGGTDCDDEDAAVRSGADEVCDDAGLDEDCNHETIQSELGDGDEDGDGHVATRCFNVRADGSENRGTDCDDAVAGVHPGAADGCGGGDEDCDGEVDEEGGRTYYHDEDGDGYGTTDDTMVSCEMPEGYVSTPGDCDDEDRDASPARPEVCGGVDEDCDGDVDESGAIDATSYYADGDGDGQAAPDAAAVRSCTALAGHVGAGDRTDCNDRDARAFFNSGGRYAEPHCAVGFACRASSGGWDCIASPASDGACPVGASSTGSPSFDFNCDGIVSPDPDCGASGQPCAWDGTECSRYELCPSGSHSAADCGEPVAHDSCALTGPGTCAWTEALLPLECG
ncbi:MAG: MopE-related protein [Sandaracinaceae bacterium]|nr:MopE-related protein [Sandaracinaceae bacterium]